MTDQTDDGRCTDWNHVWMQGCKTCVEQETEQRSYALGIEVGKHDGWIAGHAAGVTAARDAVAVLPVILYNNAADGSPARAWAFAVDLDEALAAIDALRQNHNETVTDLTGEQA